MKNIFKVANEKSVPDWFASIESTLSSSQDNAELISENLSLEANVTEETLLNECEKIEVCASSNNIYHYNSTWNNETVSHLREYASVCGLPKNNFKGVNPLNIKKASVEQAKSPIMKTASATVQEAPQMDFSGLIGDPFHIDERLDMSHMEKANWEQVTKEAKMKEPNISNGGISALRGGENYFMNSDINLASNQNSITNPNAIEKLAESTEMDTGERLKAERAEREQAKANNHSDWEKSKIESMVHSDIVPKGTVFPTESMNANPGLNVSTSRPGVYSNFDPDNIPERTQGEMLALHNQERLASIKKETVKDDWEKPSRESSRTITDDFANALAKNLKNIK
jgi:hypothetical protein